MTRKLLLFTLSTVLLLVTACAGGGVDDTAQPADGENEQPSATVPAGPESAQPESEEDLIFEPDEGYPALPTPTPRPEGYPPPPTAVPPPSSYAGDAYPAPEDTIWVLFPVGEQCAQPEESEYEDLSDAVAALTAAGVTVNASEMTDLIVCQACGCPTSAHYRVQIDATQLETAVSLGWLPEDEMESE